MGYIDKELQFRFIELFGMLPLHHFTTMPYTGPDIVHNAQYQQSE